MLPDAVGASCIRCAAPESKQDREVHVDADTQAPPDDAAVAADRTRLLARAQRSNQLLGGSVTPELRDSDEKMPGEIENLLQKTKSRLQAGPIAATGPRRCSLVSLDHVSRPEIAGAEVLSFD
jgi:hypothetical protein